MTCKSLRLVPGPMVSAMYLCLGLGSGCSTQGKLATEEVAKELDTIQVATLTLDWKPWPTIVRSQGSLYSDEQTVIGAKVAGRVATVHVDLGDSVSVGDPLITLDLAEFRLQVDQAEAQLHQARAAVGLPEGASTQGLDPDNAPPVRQERAIWAESRSSLERAERLLLQKAISQGEYDLALAAERSAEARHAAALNSVREKIALIGIREVDLAMAQQRLEDATIRAPIDGFVRSRQVALGTFVSVGEPLATVVRTDPLRFRGAVPERYAQLLSVGQEVRLQIVSVDEPVLTTITRVSPTLDPQNRSLIFEAEVSNVGQKLRSGVFAEAEIVIDALAQALVIPHSALSEFAGSEKVWKVVDGVATEQEVLAGPQRNQQREILSGLVKGDQILLDAGQGRIARVSSSGSEILEHMLAAEAILNNEEILASELAPTSETVLASDPALRSAVARPTGANNGEATKVFDQEPVKRTVDVAKQGSRG